jgi:alpha-glucosidase
VQLLRSVVDEYSERVMIGEVVLPPERAVAYFGGHLDEAHLPHNFSLPHLDDWSAEGVRAAVEGYEVVLPPGAWPNWLLGDHDFPRIASRAGPEGSRVAQMLLLTLRGTPTCYYGDELGLPDATFSSSIAVSDPQAARGGGWDRLSARTPMPWSPAPHAGFSSVEPWLPLASDDPELTVERQRDDPGSVLNLFRSLVRLRREVPALAIGGYRTLSAPANVFSFERWHPTGAVEVHLNFGDSPREVDVSGRGEVMLSTSGRRVAVSEGGRLALLGREGVIVAV